MKRKVLIVTILLGLCTIGKAQQTADTTATVLQPPVPMSYAMTPYHYYGWGLHKGLNVQLGLSAFATFGKNVPHRGGFTQSLSATYLTPLTKNNKLWLAAGGYVQNINWGSDSYRDGALYAALGYRFNEHWEAWVYAKKNIANNYGNRYSSFYHPGYWYHGPMGGMGMFTGGADVVGAAVKYNINPNISIQVNVEGAHYNNKDFQYFDQYNHPLSKP